MTSEMEPRKEITLKAKGSRVGNADREQAKSHIRRMLKSGHLSGEEAGIRVNHIEQAQTGVEIENALHDLPRPRPPWNEAWKRFDWDEPKCYTPVLVLTAILSVFWGGAPFIAGVTMGFYHDSDLMTALGPVFVVTGIIGLAASIVALVGKVTG